MSTNILDRLRVVMAEKRITQRDFAKGIKVSLTTANKLLNSEGDLSIYTIRKISEYLKINEGWLITGTGPKYPKAEVDQLAELEESGEEEAAALKKVHSSISMQELQVKNQSLEEEIRRLKLVLKNKNSYNAEVKEDSEVVFVDSNAALLYSDKFNDQHFVESLPVFSLPTNRFSQGPFRAFEVTGDAMAKKISNGDWVICKKVTDFSTIKDIYVYMIVLEDEVQCRRILNRLEERKRLRLKADNPAFGDYEVATEQIKEVWEVKSIMSFKLNNPDFELHGWIKKLEDQVFELRERMERVEGNR